MSYPFPPELQRLLHEGIVAGDYQSEDEMLLEAVRLLRQRDAELARLKESLKTRLDRLDRGEGIDLDDDESLRAFFDDVQARGHERYEAGRIAR